MKKFYFLLIALCLFTDVSAQIINFPDANFKAKLLSASPTNYVASNIFGSYFKIDANNNGEIEQSEALQVQYLDIKYGEISNISGIEYFTNLTTLYCNENDITSIDLSALINLISVNCSFNPLTSLNISGLTYLNHLDSNTTDLTSINLSGHPQLETLNLIGNEITSLNLTGLTSLKYFYCNFNLLTSLDVTGLNSLEVLSCGDNLLTQLNVSGMSNLRELKCGNNQLTSLNLDGLINCHTFYCNDNLFATIDVNSMRLLNVFVLQNNPNLTSLFIKNGRIESGMVLTSLTNLRYICSDENQVAGLQAPGREVNSYCSFTPGGTYYTFSGLPKFDSNSNGCDALDATFPYLRINKTNGGNLVGVYYSNATGQYSISTEAGTNTYTPVLEDTSYFNVSPSSVVKTFPGGSALQNFCVTANGVHPDLEVTLLPLNAARPGFDAKYKLIYKNKGNQVQSGNMNLTFNDAVLDLITANPVVSNQSVNTLSWNFTNLQPFETREISFTLNVNSPMETPAVNGGDVLNYTSSITSVATDETPNDNTFAFNQTVVNSYDPNDKTCLEGATIAPSEVGKYVHYMIRFENTGTFPAQNIVVKDMIDTAKFDISSLVPIKGSHSFVTNITAGNKVEFIFENINLPFDDANNDGYVAFKIKTKPTLVVGNTFSNSASIYFDYNFPIVTNTAVTTIQALSTQDFAFGRTFF